MTHANDLARMISDALPTALDGEVYKAGKPTMVTPNPEMEGYPNRDGLWAFHVVTSEMRGFRITVERCDEMDALRAVQE